MKITLKAVKTFNGHEGMGLNCDVYVDGVKTFHFLDDASGSIEAHHSPIYNKAQYLVLNDYVKTLPDYQMEIDGKPVFMKVTIDHLVDTAFDLLEQEKQMKKLSKKMLTCFLWGNKDFKGSYHEVNFKRPLSEVPTNVLQDYYNRYAKNLQEGQIFWNTNLAALGINTLQKVN